MTSTAQRILDEALALPEDDRRRVVERLLESMPRQTARQLEQLWNEAALRRAEAVERGETHPLDGNRAVRELEDRLHAIRRG